MAKTANKHSGERALPDGIGEGLFIQFTFDAMERLETEYGDDWVAIISERTDKAVPSVFKTVLENTVCNDAVIDFKLVPQHMTALRVCILDAMCLAIYGRTLEEQTEHEEKERLKGLEDHLERMGENPQMAEAILFLQRLGGLGSELAYGPTKSEDSPPEK